jgi:hypothetical protein
MVLGAVAPDLPAANTIPAAASSGPAGWRWMQRWETVTAGAAALLVLVASWVSMRPASHLASNAEALVTRNTLPAPGPLGIPQNEVAELKRLSPTAESVQLRVQPEAKSKHGAQKKAPPNGSPKERESAMFARIPGARDAATPDLQPPARKPVFEPAPPALQAFADTASAGAAGSNAPAREALAAAKPSAPPAPAQTTIVRSGAPASASQSLSATKAPAVTRLMAARPTAMRAVQPEVRWATSGAAVAGTVEKSRDDGRTWQSVTVAQGVQLRAVFSLGHYVWAGGTSGALFHSSDDGQQWSAIQVSSTTGALWSDIVSIRFSDPAHGAVIALNGERWTTSDGGEHWQRAE